MRAAYKLLPIFLLSIFFISGCFTPSKSQSFFSESERQRYEDFFRRFLFLDQAVYTLYGSKPMTEIVLQRGTPEERIAAQQNAMKKLSKEELIQLQESSFEYEEEYWFEETWNMWEEKLKTLPINRFLFVERKTGIPLDLQENRYIYFINISETAKILKKHYSLFKEFVGFDFDPLSTVFDAKNPNSSFWNSIWGDDTSEKGICLRGILFGYGLENSYPFSWHFSQSRSREENEFIKSILKLGSPNGSPKDLKYFNPPKSFLLPGYISFSDPDMHKEKYKLEYEKIRKIYLRGDIIECTMQQLLK
jgi:hypothetical protein